MSLKSMKMFTVQAVLALLLVACSGAHAQDDSDAAMKGDKTGTNPINFAPELRLYNEYQELNVDGDGNQNVTTLEGRMPILDGKFQVRARARYSYLELDAGDESGFGDVDFRLLTVPYINMKKKEAAAIGLEVFLDTAEEDVLGSGTTAFGPQVFFVKFLPTGLFAPGVQYKFSVDKDRGRADIDQILIDLNYLRMASDKQSWFFADPQIVIDNESYLEYAIVDLEFGAMMSKWTDSLPGHSVYVRPSFGLGSDRPVDGSVEVGYRIVM